MESPVKVFSDGKDYKGIQQGEKKNGYKAGSVSGRSKKHRDRHKKLDVTGSETAGAVEWKKKKQGEKHKKEEDRQCRKPVFYQTKKRSRHCPRNQPGIVYSAGSQVRTDRSSQKDRQENPVQEMHFGPFPHERAKTCIYLF
jgi:hypothetical protein